MANAMIRFRKRLGANRLYYMGDAFLLPWDKALARETGAVPLFTLLLAMSLVKAAFDPADAYSWVILALMCLVRFLADQRRKFFQDVAAKCTRASDLY